MDNLQPATAKASAPPRRLPLFLLGILMFLVGPGLYMLQFKLRQLEITPLYVPVLATLGVLFMVLAVRKSRGFLRIAGLVLFLVVCGLEWFMLLVGARLEPYTGPAQLGAKVPTFATTLADGNAFTDKDLAKGGSTVVVFYRGHW
jgi:hypothetical protein